MTPRKYFFAGLGIILAYVTARFLIYRAYPVTSLDSWFRRDVLMCVPRLIGFSAMLLLMRTRASLANDWTFRGLSRACVLGMIPFVLWVYYFMKGSGDRFTIPQALIGMLTSFCVALWEEAAFRGVLLDSIREITTPHMAIFASCFLFAVYHFQAQAIETWPTIFLVGVIFSSLRIRGITIAGLTLIHAVIDSAYFFTPSNSPGLTTPGIIAGAGLLLYAVIVYPYSACRSTNISVPSPK